MRMGLTAISAGDGQLHLDTENGEEIRRVQPQVAVVLGDRTPEQPGTLYITTKRLIWLSDVDKQKGYGVDFLSISLHAVSRDPEAYPLPCIYAQIESMEDGYGDEELENENSANEENLDLSQVTEMRLVPSDAGTLDDLFRVLCTCAELNPEPEGELEGEGDWIFSAEDMVNQNLLAQQDGEGEWEYDEEDMANPIGYSNGVEHSLPANILELRIDDERFEDALEMEDEAQKTKN
uniref:TSA: Wollemia nobilis Ref_Wollemi_Transcript_5658_1290 transcribed RNA sequence n=1 Tax=Wollemia nobilis TaxID=56998 RepID=A0A0C9RPE5_9CONI